MRKYMLTAALVAAGMPMTPAMARQMDGYTVRSTLMRAGPDYDYPAVQRLRRDTRVTVHGCLRDWNWCDVSSRYDRGWVARRDIVVSYRSRRRNITAYVGIGILSFSFGNYWDNYYRGRPFYSQRPRWEQHYNTNYRPVWGPRSRAPSVAPQQRPPRTGAEQRMAPQRQAMPPLQPVPDTQRVAPPQQRQPEAMQRQTSPVQRQAAPGNGNSGPSRAPGQHERGDQQRGSRDQQDNGHKSRN